MKGSVRKRTNGKWEYCFDLGFINGKRKRKTKSGFNTKSEANKALREAILLHEQGLILSDSKIPYFGDFLDYFFDTHIVPNRKYSTQILYRKIIDFHIKKDLGFYKIDKLNSSILQNYLNKKYNDGYSKNYLISIKKLLNMSLRHACTINKYISHNPVTDIYCNFNFENKKLEIISLENFKKVINLVQDRDYYYIPLMIGFYTGMRIGEILALKWENVDLNKNIISVKYTLITTSSGDYFLTEPKTKNSTRDITIGDTLCNILKEYKNRQISEFGNREFVCCSKMGKVSTRKNIGYLNKYIKNNLNIKFNFHMLRHLHATLLLESGANIKAISERLGHSSIKTTLDTYSHLTKKLEKETVDLFEQYKV